MMDGAMHIPAGGATPEPAPLSMPSQDLRRAPQAEAVRLEPRTRLARLISFGGALALAVWGADQMRLVFGNDVPTPLQMVLLGFFTVTFGWIAMSACQAVAALWARTGGHEAADETPLTTRTAIIMPVYHEDPAMTCAALEAMGEGIAALGEGEHFEIFVLSDSRDPGKWAQEAACVDLLRDALGGKMAVWYRRRAQNTARKAGNLREFVETWGARYDHMLVLDADSVMDPRTVIRMARRMQAAPRLGILQTVPVLAGGSTLFARIQQFAGRLYGPVIARGVSAWQGRDGNYWGHNAIIRVPAFASCCGLPDLPGRAPFGGHVLSHDFVEAALIRRGGWEVRMDAELQGSWEGSPQSLLDVAARDRRWAQGNLQHAKIIGAKGLASANRAHFVIGIGSYLMSPIWLMMLLTGFVLTAQSLFYEQRYFEDPNQLFPSWPVFDAERMLGLFGLSMLLLFLPKIVGLIRALSSSRLRRAHGGAVRLVLGALSEVILSALYAPVLMAIQAQQIAEILMGRDSGWNAQSREAAAMPWSEAFARHWKHVVIGVTMGALALWFAPEQFIWVAPVLVGLTLAPLLSRLSGAKLGRWLLAIPEDIDPPASFLRPGQLRPRYEAAAEMDFAKLLGCREALRAQARSLGAAPSTGDGLEDDLARLTAKAKIAEAPDAGVAARWLTKGEKVAILGDPELLGLAAARFAPMG